MSSKHGTYLYQNQQLMKTIITFYLALFVLGNTYAHTNPKRKKLLDKTFTILEANIANPAWLDTQAYQNFKETLYSDAAMRLSQEDFDTLIKKERESLPFTHFQLRPKKRKKNTKAKSTSTKRVPIVSWKEIDPNTAYLRIRSFSVRAQPVLEAVTQIGLDRYENLIIDLRNNTGGNLEGPIVLGKFLTQQPIDAGVYLTRKWYDTHNRLATPEEIQTFPFLKDMTYEGINKMFAEEAAFRMFIPGHTNPTFKGKVFVLVNENTASANEPLIDLFKKNKIATLVGSKSAGAMLNGAYFKVTKNYKMFLPIADYQTADGTRIDKVGVSPDIEVDSAKALNYVLENLIGKM